MAAVANAGYPLTPDPTAYVYFALFDLGKGLVVMLIYVAARVPCGAGAKTAAIAGLIAWLAIEVLPAIAAMPFPFYEKSFHLRVITLELLPMMVGALLGAWIYKEPAA